MLFRVLNDKRLLVGVFITGISLFLFCKYLLIENTIYSLAVALVPISIYEIHERLLLIIHKDPQPNDIFVKWSNEILNLIVIIPITAFCIFHLGKCNVPLAIIGTVIYATADLFLMICNKSNS